MGTISQYHRDICFAKFEKVSKECKVVTVAYSKVTTGQCLFQRKTTSTQFCLQQEELEDHQFFAWSSAVIKSHALRSYGNDPVVFVLTEVLQDRPCRVCQSGEEVWYLFGMTSGLLWSGSAATHKEHEAIVRVEQHSSSDDGRRRYLRALYCNGDRSWSPKGLYDLERKSSF